MTVMALFWLLVAVLTAITMAVLLTLLLRRVCDGAGGTYTQDPTVCSQMVRWCQDQLRKLDTDLHAGAMDVAGHAHVRAELGQQLLNDTAGIANTPQTWLDRRPVLLTAVLLATLPTSAVLLYQCLGKPASLWMPGDMTTIAHNDHAGGNTQIESIVDSLAQRLRDTPGDAPGRVLLVRSYSTMEHPTGAVAAYAKTMAPAPKVTNLRAGYADVFATAQGDTLTGAPIKQVRLVLRVDLDEPKALALVASATVECGGVSDAIAHWERPYWLLPPESTGVEQIVTNPTAARADRQKAPHVK